MHDPGVLSMRMAKLWWLSCWLFIAEEEDGRTEGGGGAVWLIAFELSIHGRIALVFSGLWQGSSAAG